MLVFGSEVKAKSNAIGIWQRTGFVGALGGGAGESFTPRSHRTTAIAIVPATTHTAPRIVRIVNRSTSRRKSQVPRTIHNGLVATIGETTTTWPTLKATIPSRMPSVSKV